jgi:predicted alpha-1,2-mannosidase
MFEARLDTLFALNVPENNQTAEDATGRIGEYWHGNEPSHHIIFLYDYIGKPWKAQSLVHKVVSTQYGSKPNSLCGNDDCGQMSAWYIFNALGFYPVCPSGSYYAIGSPCLPKAVVNFSNGGKLTVIANNLSKDNIYIRSMTLNGKEWNKTHIPYDEIRNGGEIVFNMTNKPNKKWGTAKDSSPPAE